MHFRSIHSLQVKEFLSFLGANIPFCILTTTFLPIHLYGHRSLPYLLYVDNALMNVGVQVSFQIFVSVLLSSDIYLRVKLLNHMLFVLSVFREFFILFS